jgi:hypothetical protein
MEKEMEARLSRAWNEIMGRSQRRKIQEVWQKAKEEEELSREEDRLAKILLEHREYQEIWEKIPLNPERETGGVNPYLHVSLHLAIENQIVEENPRQVNRYLSKKLAQGIDRHKIIHEIAAIFCESLFDTLKYQKPFDRIRYIQRLEEMSSL